MYCLPVNADIQGLWGHPYGSILVCPACAALPWYGKNPKRLEFRWAHDWTGGWLSLAVTSLPQL